MLEEASSSGYITEEQKRDLDSWSSDPVAWSDAKMNN